MFLVFILLTSGMITGIVGNCGLCQRLQESFWQGLFPPEVITITDWLKNRFKTRVRVSVMVRVMARIMEFWNTVTDRWCWEYTHRSVITIGPLPTCISALTVKTGEETLWTKRPVYRLSYSLWKLEEEDDDCGKNSTKNICNNFHSGRVVVMHREYEQLRFLTKTSLYLGNDTRWRPGVTPNKDFQGTVFINVKQLENGTKQWCP